MNLITVNIKLLSLLMCLTSIVCNNTSKDFNQWDQQMTMMRKDMDLMAKDFLESLKIAHNLVDSNEDQEVVVRSKRSVQRSQQNRYFYNKGVFRLKGIVPMFPTCARPLDLTTVPFNGQTYGICVSDATTDSPPKVSVGAVTRNGWQRNGISWTVRDPKNVVAFVDEDKETGEESLYVMSADAGSRDGTDVVVINKRNQMITREQHTVNSQFPTAIAVWKSKTDSTYHLAIANSFGPQVTKTYRSETYTYNWMKTYFDRYSQMTTFLVKDICAFNIYSNEFLAIANYEAGPNEPEVDSEIFELDIDRKKWRSIQRIRTYGAIDWEFFTFGSDGNEGYFLAVANNHAMKDNRIKYDVFSVIYKYSDNRFVPFQELPTVGATQIKSFRGANGEFILSVANMFAAVHLYQYNGHHFVQTSVQYTSGVMSPGVVSLHFDYLPFEETGVLFVSNPQHPTGHVFRMEFVLEDPLGDWYNRSLQWCESTHREVNRFGANQLMPLFKDVFYVDQKQPIVISDDLVLKDFSVESLSTPLLIDGSNGDELSHKLIDDLIHLNQELNSAEKMLEQMVNVMSNALRTFGDQMITTSHRFDSVDFDCRPEFDCSLGAIETNVLNNDNIQGLSADILPLNIDQNTNHFENLHFENLRLEKNIILEGLVNGINSTHVVTKGGSHDIVAQKTIANEVNANEVIVNHLVNNNVINPSTVLLTNGNQVINNTIVFTENILLPNLQTNGHINGVDINWFYNEVVTKDGNHIIKGQKRFNNIEMNKLVMNIGRTIDGIDVMKLWNDVLWTYGDEVIETPINFTDLVIDRNLVVEGLINGISFPKDILRTNENAIISSNKRFLSPISIDRMEVLGSMNGIGLVDRHLDIMSKSKVQTVFGNKVFNGIHLGGHSLVRGTVDGVKLSQLYRSLLLRNTSQRFDVLEINGNAFFDGGLDVKNTINGLKLENLYLNTLKLKDRHIPPFPHFKMNIADFKEIDCLSINGLNIGEDLMTKHTLQVIRGQKVFSNGLKSENDLKIKYINGNDFDLFIKDTLLYGTDQYITGEKIFLTDFKVKNLRINSLNNISMNELVFLNRDEVIIGPKVFTNLKTFGPVIVNSLESKVINDINMKEFFENSLQFSTPQIITGRLNVDSIYIPKGTNLGTRSVNGVNLRHLMSDAVLTDVPQNIYGRKVFLEPISLDALNFIVSFDNVTDFDLKNNTLLQDSNQVINSTIVFDHNIRVNENIVSKNPLINGININYLNEQTVKVDEPTIISESTQFVGPVFSSGHIELKGRIQGIDLDKEAVTLNGNNRINGLIHFTKGFQVDEHLFVNGTVDGIRVEDICLLAVRKNQNQLITGPTRVTGDVIIKGPLFVDSELNGVNIENFFRSVLKVDESSNLKGVKRFSVLVVEGPLVVKKLIAGFDVEKLFNNYMSLSRDQMIRSKVVFLNDLIINKNLKINGNVWTQNSSINGIDLIRLDSTVLKTIGDQIITSDFTFGDNVIFDKDLNVKNGRINNLNLFNDFMIRGRNNVITVPKIFKEDMIVINNMDVKDKKTVGGVDISEMYRFSVMKTNGNYRIVGQKHFNSLEVDHLKVRAINGIEISNKSLLLKYGNQIINGRTVVNNDLRVDSDINSNTINSINIPNLSKSLVLKGYNNTIISEKWFQSPLSVHNVRALGRVDGVDLNELNYFIGLPIDLRELRQRLDIEDQKIVSIEKALNHRSFELEFYYLISTIHSGPALHSYHNPITRSQHLFISGQHLTNGCQEVEVYVNSNNVFNLLTKFITIEANLMTSFTTNGLNFIVVSNSKNSNSMECLKMNSPPNWSLLGSGSAITQVFVFDRNSNKYKQMAVIHSQSVTDLKVVDDHNPNPCLLLAIPVDKGVFGQSIVICMNANKQFYIRETIPFSGTDQISVIRSDSLNRTLMASINSWQSSEWMTDIKISLWSSFMSRFDHQIQSIPFFNPSVIHFVETPTHYSIFLFAAEKKTSLTHNPLVRVFRYDNRRVAPLVEVQRINGFEVIQIESIVISLNRVLVFMLSSHRLDLFELKGSSGFVSVDRIDVRNAQSFVVDNYYEKNTIIGHFITISFTECYPKNKNICKHETHVLSSKFTTN